MNGVAEVVRTLPGPFGTRSCTRGVAGHAWTEHVFGDATAYLDSTELSRLTAIPATPGVTPMLPSSVTGPHAEWHPVAGPGLLFDTLFGEPAEVLGHTDQFAALGAFLAGVHSQPPDPRLPDRAESPAWLSAKPEVGRAVARIADELIGLAGPTVTELAGHEPSGGTRTLVHGRFSTALCAVVDGELATLGWREAGIGDPLQDLGYLLGELAEAMSATGAPAERGRALGDALVSSYEDARGGVLSGDEWQRLAWRTARRVVDHMAIHVVTYEDAQGPVRLLLRTDRVLATMLRRSESAEVS